MKIPVTYIETNPARYAVINHGGRVYVDFSIDLNSIPF